MTRKRNLIVLLVIGVVCAVGAGVAMAVNANVVKQAAAATKAAEKGTSKSPNGSSRPAAKGKKVFVIDAGHVSESSGIPADAAMLAGKTLGWKMTALDGNLNPATYSGLVNQAVSQGANGIILDAIDCKDAEAPLQQAKKKHIVVLSIYAYDCNDPVGGNHTAAEFSGCINYNNLKCSQLGAFAESYGADQANYIINATKGKGYVLVVNDPTEYTVLNYTGKGFEAQLKKAGEPFSEFDFKIADLASGKLQGEITAKLQQLKSKNVAWVKSPFSAATVLGGLAAATKQVDPSAKVMGGEGFPDELKTPGVAATNVIDSRWTAWAAIDSMNSIFDGKKPVPSGIGWTIVQGNHYPSFPPFWKVYSKAWGKSAPSSAGKL